MKVFMLGWEFPPFISGGLGTACYGLTKAMSQLNVEIVFCLPKIVDGDYSSHVKLLDPGRLSLSESAKINRLNKIKFCAIDSPLQAYTSPESYHHQIEENPLENYNIHRSQS